VPLVALASTLVTPIRFYPLYCTLYCCALTLTLTRRKPSALVTLSFAFISDTVFKFCSVLCISYNFHSTFRLRFCLELISFFPNSVFLLEVGRELPQRSIFEHITGCSYFRCCFAQIPAPGWRTPHHTYFVSGYFNPVCYSIFVCVSRSSLHFDFLFCSKLATPFSIHPFFFRTVASNSYSSWDVCPWNLWTLPTVSKLANMNCEFDLPCRCSSNGSGQA
jgi:hypothetical protein